MMANINLWIDNHKYIIIYNIKLPNDALVCEGLLRGSQPTH